MPTCSATRTAPTEAETNQSAGPAASDAAATRPDNTSTSSRPQRDTWSPVSDYIRDGAEIYRRSFAIIRAEADLSGLPEDVARVAVRMMHACGQVDLPADLGYSPDVIHKAAKALREGAPILCDAQMVASGITRKRLPAGNDVLCTLGDPRTPQLADHHNTTRSAAAVELWREHLDGAVVAIGNAPTALFHLLDLMTRQSPRPAAIIGVPVGFVGAAESKE